ncbi:MAG: sugar transferase [Treponema sp.]|jgi:lipopolysaccharide/colanic/teichoic acid biosynthesis glycosyltransferase|nr:sugar transferase [Treponema sp.]
MLNKKYQSYLIRFFDILFSFFAIIVLFPLMFPIMIILKLTGEHDIFYRQKRVGRYGKEFNLLKFATMLRDSPNLPGGIFTYKNDPRILPLGKFLRKTKINELPQLINIFIGQMSIIGYRPLVREGYEEYSDEVKQQLYNFNPGLSGIGSIVFRNEEEIMQKVKDQEDFYRNMIIPYKGELEKWYTQNIGLVLYFKIIFFTAISVLNSSSDFWIRAFDNLPPTPKELEIYLK